MKEKNNKSSIINEIEIQRGSRVRINIDMGRMHDFTDLKMPIEVVSGVKEGPTLFVCSTIHGDEINGIEIVRRLLDYVEIDRICGTLIAIPIVNIFGFNDHSRYLPDRRDLNRCFPGIKNGSLASQLAYKFMQEIVLKSDYGIDIHSGSFHRSNFPQVRANIDDENNFELAKVFNAPAIINSNLRDGSLRSAGTQANIPIILYEAGEILRFDENAIEIGLSGILNVMEKIGMIEKAPKNDAKKIFVALSSSWLRASQSGVFTSCIKLGDMVQKGQIIGSISNPFGDNKIEIRTNEDGMVIGLTMMPLVNKGDALFHIASQKNQIYDEKFLFNDNNNLILD
jgi:predicted deacylase